MNTGMQLRHLFTLNFFFAVFFGLSCTVAPRFVFWMYGLVPDGAAIWTARLVGGSILGFATLMGFGRNAASVETRRAIAIALLIQDVIGCMASVEIQFSGTVTMFGWFSVALYGFLAFAYAFFLFIKPGRC
jgi:hypothetical protein